MNSNWKKIAKVTYDWIEQVGWHNRTVLESLALIGSEVGEAAAECVSGKPTPMFGEELADIALRIIDLAEVHQVNIDDVIGRAKVSWHGNTLPEHFMDVYIDLAKWANTARHEKLGEDFGLMAGVVMKRIIEVAEMNDIELYQEAAKKMEINKMRGTRGRHV